MLRLSPTVAFALVLVIGLQMAACLASGDCIQFHVGRSVISAGSAYDCDGCGCCHLHIGFQFAPPPRPFAPVEPLQAHEQPSLCAQARPVPYRPPRS